MFPRIDYVEWVVPRIGSATHDLGSSDLRHAETDALVPPRLADHPVPERGVRDLVAAEYGVDRERVLVTAGASSANLLAAATALDGSTDGAGDATAGGDRVLVEKPGYEPHTATPRGLGATVDRFVRTPGDDWQPDPDRIAGATMPETVLVALSNRHNPTGVRSDRERLAACAAAARETGADAGPGPGTGARLLVDEVYAPYGAEPVAAGPSAFGAPTAAGIEGTVVTGSLTKFWGFGGLRIGWLVADEAFVARAGEVAVHLSNVAEPSRHLARRALGASESLAAEARERCARNAALLRGFVDDRPALSATVPEGCPYGLVTHADLDGDALAERAADEGVLVVPGRFFGARESVRVALGRPTPECETGLTAFGAAVDRA